MNVQQLRQSVPEGYNLAALVPLTFTTDQWYAFFAQSGVPVLAEAEGAIGVLRAMELRCGPVLRGFAGDGQTHRLLHLKFLNVREQGKDVVHAMLHDWTFKIDR